MKNGATSDDPVRLGRVIGVPPSALLPRYNGLQGEVALGDGSILGTPARSAMDVVVQANPIRSVGMARGEIFALSKLERAN